MDAGRDDSLFVRWTIYRPVTILVLFVALLVVGIVAYPGIPVQLAPPGISMGAVSIWIPVPDGTPQEVMEQVAKPAEDLLRTIPGVEEIFSRSGATSCHLRVEYDPHVDGDTIAADIRERIDRAKLRWPEGVDRYHLWRGRMDSDMPIYVASVGLDVDEERVDVNDVFENVIQNRLLAIDGVARVTFWGLIDKRVTVSLDNDRVAGHAVPVRQLIQRLASDNLNITGGKIRDGDREYLVRSVGKFGSFDEIRDYPINDRLRITDVAEVGYYRAIKDRLSRVNGLFSHVVVVHKDSLANTIDVCERVGELMNGEIRENLPRWYPGVRRVEIHAFLDQGQVIRISIDSLRENGIWGGLFAMVVLFAFFRHVRLTLLVTLAIPFSLLITVVWIYFRDGTFNIMSLMGMSLGIGMLVDNSIVVVENIVRKREGGLGRIAAAVEGVREVGLAVSLATLTTVVVFLPIMFLGDPRFKAIYQEVGGPLCVSVLASLVVALIFIPQGVIHFFRGRREGVPRERTGDDRTAGMDAASVLRPSRVNRWTQSFLDWCLRHRFEAFVLFALVVGSVWLISGRMKKSDDMGEGSSRVEFRVTLPKNTSLSEANDVFGRLEASLDARRDELGIRSLTSWFDSRDGNLNVFFEPGRRVRREEFFERIKPFLPRIADVRVELEGDVFSREGWGERVRVFVRGGDFRIVSELGDEVQRALLDREMFPEITDVVQAREDERDEVRVTVRRDWAQHHGIDAGSVGSMVSWAIRGAVLPDYETEDRELPFWIRYEDSDKENIDDLRAIPVYREDGVPIRLENLATYARYPGPGSIRRVNGKMTLAYTVEAETENTFELKNRVRRRLARISVPEGFEVTTDPRRGGFAEDLESTIFAMVLAMCLVFFVMGFLFESVLLPFSVVLSIPHAFFGSMWALYLTGVPVDAGAMVGMIMLVGIVVNNAIVLVDTINRRRGEGIARHDAILESARIRFRPVWMTALTTIFGLLPLAIFPQTGEGMDYRSMAVVLVGGLSTSTFFTLFVVPLFYTFFDDLRRVSLELVHRVVAPS